MGFFVYQAAIDEISHDIEIWCFQNHMHLEYGYFKNTCIWNTAISKSHTLLFEALVFGVKTIRKFHIYFDGIVS
jgi:hypothetical protein